MFYLVKVPLSVWVVLPHSEFQFTFILVILTDVIMTTVIMEIAVGEISSYTIGAIITNIGSNGHGVFPVARHIEEAADNILYYIIGTIITYITAQLY